MKDSYYILQLGLTALGILGIFGRFYLFFYTPTPPPRVSFDGGGRCGKSFFFFASELSRSEE